MTLSAVIIVIVLTHYETHVRTSCVLIRPLVLIPITHCALNCVINNFINTSNTTQINVINVRAHAQAYCHGSKGQYTDVY